MLFALTLAQAARTACRMFLTPLSVWHALVDEAESGLLLGVATAPTTNLARSCDRLLDVIGRFADLRQG